MIIGYSRHNLGLDLFDIGAFQDKRQSPEKKGFKLKLHEENPEEPLSPFFLNLRTPDHPKKPGPLNPEIIRKIGLGLYQKALEKNLIYDCVAGVPVAGNPLAMVFAEIYFLRIGGKLPVLKLKKQESEKSRQIIEVEKGSYSREHTSIIGNVLLIDDLTTEAHSKIEAIEVLEKVGLVVRDVLVLVDREQGGAQELKEKGYNLHAVFPFSELLEFYFTEGRISNAIYHEIKNYLAE